MRLSKKFAAVVFGVIFIDVYIANFLLIPLIKSVFELPQNSLLLEFLLLSLTVVIPATFLIWLILKRIIIKPIASFNQIAKIIASGNLGQRLIDLSSDEIGDLGRNINTFVQHLVTAFQNMAFSLKNEKIKEKELALSLTQLMKEKAKDKALLTSIGDGVIAIDSSNKIILFNQVATRLTGYEATEVFNMPYGNILRIINEKEDTPIDDFINNAFLGIIDTKLKHLAILTKDERKIPISISIGQIRGDDNNITGVVLALRDITYERELDKMKDEFLSIASHELRTPMSAIKNLISMIFEGDYGSVNEELKDPLKDISSSTERLINLVNDMLDVSRIESGRLKIIYSDCDISNLVAETVRTLQSLVQQKNIKLVTESGVSLLVKTDVDKINEVLNNLIGNAIKFTGSGGITVSTKRVGNFVHVSVADTGIGIAKEDQIRLFSKFSQINTNEFVRPPGTGLGLYISREFVRKLGGDLWLEQSEVGKGSTFTFSLPVLNPEYV